MALYFVHKYLKFNNIMLQNKNVKVECLKRAQNKILSAKEERTKAILHFLKIRLCTLFLICRWECIGNKLQASELGGSGVESRSAQTFS